MLPVIRVLLLGGLLLSGLSCSHRPDPQSDIPKPLPDEIVHAWQKAGAHAAWYEVTKMGFFGFHDIEEQPQPGWLPELNFVTWKDGMLKDLPAPKTPFALALNGGHATDASLKELADHNFASLVWLRLDMQDDSRQVTNAMKDVARLRQLRAIDFDHVKVTDADVKELTQIRQLASINLFGSLLTDEGIKEIAKLQQLATLNLSQTEISDSGLKELGNLKQLTSLVLGGTKVTDAGLKEIGKLQKLTNLFLGRTVVTDAGLKELAPLNQLTSLDLGSTKITDAGLKELGKLQQLTSLNLLNTEVTKSGIDELQKALPRCKIEK